jgi:hypothetical protein
VLWPSVLPAPLEDELLLLLKAELMAPTADTIA